MGKLGPYKLRCRISFCFGGTLGEAEVTVVLGSPPVSLPDAWISATHTAIVRAEGQHFTSSGDTFMSAR